MTTRCTADWTSMAMSSKSPSMRSLTSGPVSEVKCPAREAMSAIVPGGDSRAWASGSRSRVTMRRMAVMASSPAASMRSRAGSTACGLLAATVCAAWASTTMPVT